MKYYLWVKQAHGCDYTIACGETLIEIDAENSASAIKRTLPKLRELGWGPDGEIELEYARLLSIANVREIELNNILEMLTSLKVQEREEQDHLKDELEFERLRQKLGR